MSAAASVYYLPRAAPETRPLDHAPSRPLHLEFPFGGMRL